MTVLFYDGDCALCQGTVQFILRHERDPNSRLRFAPLNGVTHTRITGHRTAMAHPPETLELWDAGKLYTRYRAVVRIGQYMGGFWRYMALAGRLVPEFLGNWIYDGIAARRYSWFGKTNGCWLPKPEYQNRFLE